MPRAGLSRAAVVLAAVHIADTEGVDALSMRRISQKLGVTPMAIYRHLQDKSALIDLVVDEALRVVPLVDPGGHVFAEMSRCFDVLYRLLRDHPGLAKAAGERPLEGPVATRLGDRILELLQHNGIDEEDAADLLVAAFSLTLGFALYRTSRDARDAKTSLQVGEEAPAVRRSRERLAAAGSRDSMFIAALEHLIGGYIKMSATVTKAQTQILRVDSAT